MHTDQTTPSRECDCGLLGYPPTTRRALRLTHATECSWFIDRQQLAEIKAREASRAPSHARRFTVVSRLPHGAAWKIVAVEGGTGSEYRFIAADGNPYAVGSTVTDALGHEGVVTPAPSRDTEAPR